jgi:hypothetical protein
MTIPANPVEASTKEVTFRAIGMALNGVPIYNDRGWKCTDAGRTWFFDRAGAHPGPGNTIITIVLKRFYGE